MYHIFCIHFSVNGHLGDFHVLIVRSKAAMNIGLPYLFKVLFSPDICLGVRLMGHMVALFLVFLRNLHTILHSGCTKLHFQVHFISPLHLIFFFFFSGRCHEEHIFSSGIHECSNNQIQTDTIHSHTGPEDWPCVTKVRAGNPRTHSLWTLPMAQDQPKPVCNQ